MATTIDDLQIEISSSSSGVVDGLDALTSSLERLKKTTGNLGKSLEGVNFTKFNAQMRNLSTALQPLQGFKTQAGGLLSALKHFKQTSEELNKFSGFDRFSGQIKLLADSLQPLSGVGSKLGATLNALGQVFNISQQLEAVNFESFGGQITNLTQSLSPLGTIQSKLGSTLNQLSRFGQVTQQLDMSLKDTDISNNILKLVKALEPLSTIGKSQLTTFITHLNKLPDVAKQLASIDIDAFARQIERVTNALKPLANEMNKISAGFSTFPSRIQRIITSNERLVSSNNTLSKSYNLLGISFKSIHAKLGVAYIALRKVANKMADWVMESNDYVENLNLFTVSMRGATDEALRYANKVRDVFGIDPSEWIRFQAVFQNMYTGFGVANKEASIMSKTLTQLGYDLATIFNVDYSVAMEKLQSAISGQPRPMREWGFDMSESTLKLVAMNLGIKENVETMTQFEKSQLRFVQLLTTANKQGVLGNFARELITPANAMRILNQQIVQLKRALGNMLIPILMKILPYLQAFVQVLTKVIRELSILSGFTLPKIDYSGIGDMSMEVEDMGNGLDDATDSAKKLKNAMAGFDDLNVISEATGSSKAKRPTGGYDLGIDPSKYDYDFFGEGIKNQVNEIAESIEAPFRRALDIAIKIGVVIASWKMSKSLFDLFTGTSGKGFLSAVGSIGKAFISPSGETIKLASLLGNSTAYVGTAAVIAGIAATISIIVLKTVDLVKNSKRFRDGLSATWKGLKTAGDWIINIAIPKIGDFFANLIPVDLKNSISTFFEPLNGLLKELDISTSDWLLTLGSIALLFTPAAPFATAILIFEGITLGIRALGWASSDAIEEIDILGEGISDITKSKMQPFLDQMRELDDAIKTIDWNNMTIDQSIVDDVATKVRAISETIISELDSDKNDALATLAPLKKALGEEAYNELLADNTKYYDEMIIKVTDNENRINEIIATAKAENRKLTQTETDEISRIQNEMMDTGVQHLSDTEIEYQTIMNRLKDNSTRVSLEQASSIIQDAQRTRDETIGAAETQYAKIELEAKRMLDVGAINDEQYKSIIDVAAQTRDKTISAANEQYDTIYDTTTTKLGDTAKYIDEETGEIKSKWDVFCDETALKWNTAWTDIKDKFATWGTEISKDWGTFKNNFKTGWHSFWNGIGNFFINIWNGIVGGFENAINGIIGGINNLINSYNGVASKIPVIGNKLTISNISTVSFGRVPNITVPQFQLGGLPDTGQMFIAREAGAEMVGSIGRRTAVANNDQIVEAVSRGVYDAVKEVVPDSNGQPIELNVYLDGKQITSSVEKVQRDRGATLLPGGVVFG